MPYSNIPGVRAAYLDGEFRIPQVTAQENILLVGPATSGLTDQRFNVTAVSAAEREFGAASAVLRGVHEALAQGAENISVLRSGGRQGSWVFTDSASATLTITPEYRDNQILNRYALIIENDGSDNRYLVYDQTDEEWVYDSDNILTLDTGVVSVVDTGIDLFTLFDKATPALADNLATVATGDFTVDGTATASSVSATQGSDGTADSRAERYAALNSSYFNLDFKDADYLIPLDVYVDDDNAAEDAAVNRSYNPASATTDSGRYGFYWKGAPAAGAVTDRLGWVWEYVYRGKKYTYFSDVDDYATGVAATPAAATLTVQTSLVLTAQKVGKGGNAITLQINAAGAAGPTVTVTETDYGFDILVTDDGTASITDTVAAINTALGLKTLSTGVLASTLVQASGTSATTITTAAKTNLAGGTGGAVLTHADLTGDTIPSAVSTRWGTVADAELRECNFAHQLASHCWRASTTWSTTVGVISFKAPTGYSRSVVADWVGELPEYTDQGTYKYIDSPSDNGAGLLGNKFFAGKSVTSEGYRNALVVDGNSTDGYAYGGLILTVGASLPNGTKHPYGISDADEAVDAGNVPVDIGKHLLACYDWPVLSNGYNGGSSYRGAIPVTVAGKVVTLPPNEEPIGLRGFLRGVQNPPRIHSSQLSDLAGIRLIGLRREDGFGLVLTSARTAAHPDSDYTRLSTIRCVNELLTRIRRIAKPYIGNAFTPQSLLSLDTAIQGLLQATRGDLHEGARHRLQYTRADKIAGRMTIKLRMVPPFSIEEITVEVSLAADEQEL